MIRVIGESLLNKFYINIHCLYIINHYSIYDLILLWKDLGFHGTFCKKAWLASYGPDKLFIVCFVSIQLKIANKHNIQSSEFKTWKSLLKDSILFPLGRTDTKTSARRLVKEMKLLNLYKQFLRRYCNSKNSKQFCRAKVLKSQTVFVK